MPGYTQLPCPEQSNSSSQSTNRWHLRCTALRPPDVVTLSMLHVAIYTTVTRRAVRMLHWGHRNCRGCARTDGRTDGRTDRWRILDPDWTNERMNGWTNKRMKKRTDERMNWERSSSSMTTPRSWTLTSGVMDWHHHSTYIARKQETAVICNIIHIYRAITTTAASRVKRANIFLTSQVVEQLIEICCKQIISK